MITKLSGYIYNYISDYFVVVNRYTTVQGLIGHLIDSHQVPIETETKRFEEFRQWKL